MSVIKKYKALILDMDGTIMNSLAIGERSLRHTCEKWKIPVTQQLVDLVRYSTAEAQMEALNLGEQGVEFIRDMRDYFVEHINEAPLFKGIEALFSLPVKKGIVTSEARFELEFNLKRFNISDEVFPVWCCGDDTPYEKPHPFPLLHCLKQLEVNPCDALYVGDSLNDMRCANSAGVDFGLAFWGANTTDGYDKCDYIFKSPEEVLSCFLV